MSSWAGGCSAWTMLTMVSTPDGHQNCPSWWHWWALAPFSNLKSSLFPQLDLGIRERRWTVQTHLISHGNPLIHLCQAAKAIWRAFETGFFYLTCFSAAKRQDVTPLSHQPEQWDKLLQPLLSWERAAELHRCFHVSSAATCSRSSGEMVPGWDRG